jgi:hypothetical protein
MAVGKALEAGLASLIGSVITLDIDEEGAQGAAFEIFVKIDVYRAIVSCVSPHDRRRRICLGLRRSQLVLDSRRFEPVERDRRRFDIRRRRGRLFWM